MQPADQPGTVTWAVTGQAGDRDVAGAAAADADDRVIPRRAQVLARGGLSEFGEFEGGVAAARFLEVGDSDPRPVPEEVREVAVGSTEDRGSSGSWLQRGMVALSQVMPSAAACVISGSRVRAASSG